MVGRLLLFTIAVFAGLTFGELTPKALSQETVRDPCLRPAIPPRGVLGRLLDAGKEEERQRACAQARASAEAAERARREQEAANERARQDEVQRAAQAQAASEAAARQRAQNAAAAKAKAAAAAQLAQENSPDNHCKKPEFARVVIDEFNKFRALRRLGEEIIDIEHMTTLQFDAEKKVISCHGVFVVTNGAKLAGTFEMRRNIAGDPISIWKADR